MKKKWYGKQCNRCRALIRQSKLEATCAFGYAIIPYKGIIINNLEINFFSTLENCPKTVNKGLFLMLMERKKK